MQNTACRGTEADDTALFNRHWFEPLPRPGRSSLAIESQLADSELVGIYVTSPQALSRGRRLVPLRLKQARFDPGPLPPNTLVIAINHSTGTWSAWSYRKFVWMF